MPMNYLRNTITGNMIRLVVSVCCALFVSAPAMAGQYLKIEKIDAASEFPRINLFLTISGIDCTSGDINDDDLIIHEDGSKIDAPLAVKKSADSENYLYLVFSIDSSKSISKKFLKKIKSSAREIAGSIGAKDRIAVYRFDDTVELLNSFSQNKDEIIHNISRIDRHGKQTLLYTSIYDSIELLDKVKQINKKVVVFTDGKDEGSSVGEDDIIQFASNAMIPIYFICCKDSKNIRSMARISKRTGGKLIYSTSNDIPGMYRTIMAVMKNRYTATYRTKLTGDGLNHRLEVRMKHRDIRDRDSELFFLEKKQVSGMALSNAAIIAINILLLILLAAVVIFFLYREKIASKKKSQIEKEYLLTSLPGDGETNARRRIDDEASGESEMMYGGAWLLQKNGPGIGKKYPIQTRDIIIGSGRNSTIVIDDKNVSEKHSKIKNVQGMYTLFDLISDKGTYLNDKKLLRPKVLHDWDEITIGTTKLIFRASQIRTGMNNYSL